MSKKIAMAVLVAILVQPVLGLLPLASQQAQACCNPIKWIKKKFKRSSTQTAQPLNQQELPIAPQLQRESTALNTEYLSSTEAIGSQGSVQYGRLLPDKVRYATIAAENATAGSLANEAMATEQFSTVAMLGHNPTMPAGVITAGRIPGKGARNLQYQGLPAEAAAETVTVGKAAAVGESIAAKEVSIAGEAVAAKSKLRQTDSLAAQEIRSVAARAKH